MDRNSEIFITDFRPAVSTRGQATLVPYTLNGCKGHMLRLHDHDDTVLSMPSPVKGWHKVYMGDDDEKYRILANGL